MKKEGWNFTIHCGDSPALSRFEQTWFTPRFLTGRFVVWRRPNAEKGYTPDAIKGSYKGIKRRGQRGRCGMETDQRHGDMFRYVCIIKKYVLHLA